MADQTKDTRVVEMQFDSRDFDKNIRKSQKSLEDFKKELNFDDAVKQMQSLDTEGNSILQNMARNLQKLTTELTGVGSVSSYIAQKIKGAWQGAMNSVEGFAKSLTTVQKAAGEEKYNKLLKAVQTIKNATGDTENAVYSVMSTLNHYTDETSYDFADMAQNIGKFTTAGVGLKDAEAEMEGIANWAALAGQGVQEAQRAMYNISQAMSAGYMQKIDYKSIQNASMDIRKFRIEALKAGVAAGTLKETADGVYKTVKGGKTVNVDNFVETLQFKWFDKKTMENVFKVFSDNTKGIGKEAYQAAQRCVTLSDAINAIKDMLSTGWMQTYQHIFGKLSDAMNLFSGLCIKASDALAQFVELRNGILEQWSHTGRDSLWGALVGEIESPDGATLFKGAYGLLDLVVDLGDQIRNAFVDFVLKFADPNNRELYKENPEKMYAFLAAGLTTVTDKFRDFTTQMGHFFNDIPVGQTESRIDQVRHIVEAVYATVLLVTNVIGGIGRFVGEVLGQLKPTGDAVLYLIGYISQLFTGQVVKDAKKNTIGGFFHSLAESLRPLTSIINLVIPVIANLIGKVMELLNATGLLQPAVIALISGKIIGLLGALDKKKGVLGFIAKLFGGKFGGAAKIVTIVSGLLALIKKFTGIDISGGAVAWVQNLIGNAKNQMPAFKKRLLVLETALKATLKQWLANLKLNGPEFGNALKNKAAGLLDVIKSFFSDVVGRVLGFFAGSAAAEEASEAVNNAVINILTPGKDVKGNTSESTGGAAKSLRDRLHAFWDPIANTFTNFFNVTIPNFFNSPAMQGVKKFFSGTTFMGLLGGVTNLVKWLAIFRGGSGLVKVGKGVGKLGKGIGIFGKNLKNLNLVGAFKDMFNLTNIINSNNVDNSRTTNWTNFGNGLLKVAAAFGIVVASSIWLSDTIGKMKPDQLKNTGIALAALIGSLVAVDIATKKFGGGGSGILKMAAGMALLLIPLKALMSIGEFRNLDGTLTPFSKGLIKLAVTLGIVATAARIAGGKGAKGLVGMAVGLNLLMIPLRQLMNMKLYKVKDDGTWDPNGGGLGQALVALGALMVTMGGAARLGGGNKLKGMIAFAISLNLLIIPIRKLAEMNSQQYLQGILGVGAIIMAIAGLAAVAKNAKLASLAGVVGAVTALSFIGTLIGAMPVENVIKGFAPIILMIGSMALLVGQAKKLDAAQIKGLRSIFVSFALTIGIIAGSLVAMTVLDVKENILLEFFGGLILTLTMMGVAINLAKKTDAAAIGKMATVFGLFSLFVGVVAGSLVLLTKMNIGWEMLATMLGGLSLLLGIMGLTLPALSKLNFKGILVAAAGMGLVVVAIMGAISLMAGVLLGSVGNALETISERLKTTSGLLKDFFDRMQAITQESVNHAGVVFDGLKEIILKFVGFGDHTGDIRSVMSQLNMLGTGIELFFVNEEKYPDPEESKSFKILNKFIEMSPSLAAFNIGDLPSQLMYLGVGLGLFHNATKDIPDGNVPALALLEGIFGQADNISKFANLPLDDFRAQMSGLGGAMSLYAKGAKEVTGIDADIDAPSITDSIKILSAVAQAMSGQGEDALIIPDNIPDSEKLGLFAGQLEALATALSTFASAAHEMETDTTNAVALLKFLGEIGGYVTPETLGVTNVFKNAGVDSGADGKGGTLGQFALDIGALGTALNSFAGSITGNDAQFKTGLGFLDHFQELNRKLTKDNLAFTKVFDEAGVHSTALGTFSTDIGALGRALASFAQNATMDDGTQADFTYSLKALNFLATLKDRLPDVGGLQALINGHKLKLDELGDEVQGLGQSLKDFSDKISGATGDGKGLDYDAVNGALGVITKLVELTNMLAMVNPETGDIYGAGYMVSNLNQIMTGLLDENLWWVDGDTSISIATRIAQFARMLSDAFTETEAEAGNINTAAIDAFAKIAASLSNLAAIDPSVNFEYPGQMISAGIATGIRNGESEVVQAVVDVVNAAIEAGNQTAVIKSPSHVFAEMGRYMDLGLAQGLTQNQNDVENAAGGMVQGMIDRSLWLISLINQAVAENADLEPTITPVLDLSNITGAGRQIGGYFNEYGLNLTASSNLASASQHSGPPEVMVQNPTDLSGIQSSIASLSTDILGLQTAISNIQIVLNTGVIAGGVTDGVDLNLGRKSLYASRRN